MPVAQLDDTPLVEDQEQPSVLPRLPKIAPLEDVPVMQEAVRPATGKPERQPRFELPSFPEVETGPPKPVLPVSFGIKPSLPKEAPKQEPEFKGDLFSNFTRGAYETVKGIADLFLVGLPKSLQMMVQDPKHYIEEFKTHVPKAGKAIWDQSVMRWVRAVNSGPMYVVAEMHNDPFGTLIDLSMAAGAIGETAKIAGAVSKAAGAARAGEAIARVGEVAAKAGTYLDPIQAAAKGLGKVGKPVLELLGVGPETKAIIALKDVEQSAEMKAKADTLQRIITKNLSPEERVALDRVISVNAKGELAKRFPELSADSLSPAAKEAHRVWQEIVGAGEEASLKERPGVLSQKRADIANAKRAAIYLRETTGEAFSWKRAYELMKKGEIEPTYASMFKEEAAEWSFLNTLKEDVVSLFRSSARKVGRLEERLAQGKFIRDPAVYQARQVSMFHDLNWRLRWMDRVLQHLKGKGLVRVVQSAKDVPPGYEVIPETIYRKYYDTLARAGGVVVDNITRQIALNGVADADQAVAAMQRLIQGDVARDIGRVRHIAVPTHVARQIAREFKLPGPWGRIYDRGLDYWKASATVFNPKYWVPVAVSNAFMGVITGLGLKDFYNFWKYKGDLPAMLRGKSELAADLQRMNLAERVSNTMGELGQRLDRDLLRGPTYMKSVRETYDSLKATGRAFFDAQMPVEEFIRATARSTDELSAIQRRVELLQQQIAEQIPKYRELAKAEAKTKKVLDIIEKNVKAKHGAKGKPSAETQGKIGELNRNRAAYQVGMDEIKQRILTRLQESGQLQARVPELAKYADVAERALTAGNVLTGNYNRLHPIERAYFRRIVPFYNFTKAMTLLAFRLPSLYPVRTFMWHNLAQLVNDAVTDEEQPEWVQKIVPVALTKDGGIIGFNLTSANPWQGAKTSEIGEGAMPGIFDIARQNPIVKLWMDVSDGIPSWSMKPITPGESATRLDDGRVIRMGEDGRLRTIIPQLGFLRAAWNLFPQSQLFDNLFLAQAQTDRGWVFSPDPIYSSKTGKPIEKAGIERFPLWPVRVQEANIKEEKVKEKAKIIGIMRSFMDDARRAPPEKRDAFIKIISDWWKDRENRWRAIAR